MSFNNICTSDFLGFLTSKKCLMFICSIPINVSSKFLANVVRTRDSMEWRVYVCVISFKSWASCLRCDFRNQLYEKNSNYDDRCNYCVIILQWLYTFNLHNVICQW